MTKTFAGVATVFAAIELFTCYVLWCDQDASKFGEQTLAPANFAGWKLAVAAGKKWLAVERQLDFFSLWVGNNKFIFSVLLLVCAFSRDNLTRLAASFFTAVGCAIYWMAGMDASLRRMEEAGDVRSGQADEVDATIRFLLFLWVLAFAAEAHETVKIYRIRSQSKVKAA